MFCGFGGSSFGFSPWMSVMMGIRILVFIILIVFGVKLIKNYTSNSNGALKILDEKFASGEISEEEYIKRRTVMTQKK
ncbi:SHOCT domain-containing protein [Clostridium sp. OS1-26]|uniref:SHOCT domain-containing protein n=1 Tax=Clostridium sp. OS1-26 TaxID=3070681 RepID=UPI0027E1C161|nr:SHOCT domain-containing protein [Clostridium sp. OS1-26]WML35546.1 SHOCT domain-containing protein [Clostridium sp. OS1-26]